MRPPARQRQPQPPAPRPAAPTIRASRVLRARRLWVVPLAIASIFVAIMTSLYVGSVVDPVGHLRGLPVLVVEDDRGAAVEGKRIDIGASLVTALRQSRDVTRRLDLIVVSASQARAAMDRGAAYATLTIPSTLTASVLLGLPRTGAAARAGAGPGAIPPRAVVTLRENRRLGSLAASLAGSVTSQAVAELSPRIGQRLASLTSRDAPPGPVLADHLADPITFEAVDDHPLPSHSALGLSAFYIALLAIMSGFVAGSLVNASVDGALGYASSELGPVHRQRRPLRISRRGTFLVKWAIGLVAAPLLTGVLLLVAVGMLGMDAPRVLELWGLVALSAFMITTATLALLAVFGSIGQLFATTLLVYLSLASSGATVPVHALPGFFGAVGEVEPLRNVLVGTRAIMYFDGRGDAGLDRALVVIGGLVVCWGVIGLGVVSLYDRKGMHRIAPDVLGLVDRVIDERIGPGGAEDQVRSGDAGSGRAHPPTPW